MKAITTIVLILSLVNQATAQRICGSEAYTQQLIANNPAIAASINKAELQMKQTITLFRPLGAARDTAANELIIIPVVIHVVYKTGIQNISDAQILSQLDVLNRDFGNQNPDRVNTPAAFKSAVADCRIKFSLAQVDPQGRRTTGIVRKYTNTDLFTADDAMKNNARGGSTGWDSKKYLNIWVCALNGRSLGYATTPGSPADLDGVVIAYDVFGTTGVTRAPFNKGRSATHEIGHWMGLKHIWGDTNCGDDGVDDTPRQRSYNYGCPSFPRVTSCSQTADGDMFMNFMDYTDDACMNMFTNGQKKRMRSLFAIGKLRNTFLTSFASDSTSVQGGPVVIVDSAAVVTPAMSVQSVNMYPNPVISSLTVEITTVSASTVNTIKIFNTVGVCVYKAQVSQLKSTINIAQLTSGIYMLQVGEGKEVITKKIVKM